MMREPLTYNFIVSGIYTGIFISFYSGVYQTCLGHMQMLTEYPKAVIGLTSIMIGIGGLLASTFDVIAKRMGNNTVMILTLVLTEVAFLLMFLFIPSEASRVSTSSIGYIQPNVYMALFCGCVLGIIDIIWNVQVSGLINKIYEKKQVSAIFSINKMIQSLSAAIAFMYSSHLDFQWQMLILTIFSFVNHFLLTRIETNRTLLVKDKIESSAKSL